jgi:PAS domain S-box-containing protein
MLGLVVGLLVILTLFAIRGQSQVLQQAMATHLDLRKEILAERGRTMTDNLKTQAKNDIAAYNFSGLSEVLTNVARENDDLAYAILMDAGRVALIHTLRPELRQEDLKAPEDLHAAAQNKSAVYEYGSGDDAVMEFIEPIRFGNQPWGTLRLGFSLKALNAEMQKTRLDMEHQMRRYNLRSAAIFLGFLLASTMVVLALSHRLTDPIIRLTESARRLATGDFSAAESEVPRSGDEIGILFEAFNTMAANLKRSYSELEQLSRDFQGVIEQAPDGIVVHRDGAMLYANRAMCRALGYAGPDSCSGRNLLDAVIPPDQDRARKLLSQDGNSPDPAELRFKSAARRIVTMEVTPVPSVRFGGEQASMLLARDITARRGLEQEIVLISTREQERIAHDLHDGLGQLLTGVAYKGKMLEASLKDAGQPAAEQATAIVALANEALAQARMLARNLDPVELSEEGLALALNALAHRTHELFGVACHFHADATSTGTDKFTATHLYRIAQEAVNNAVKHGEPERISIEIRARNGESSLIVADDGVGLPDHAESAGGMGLRSMHYRARMIRGSLEVSRNDAGGTTVRCHYREDTRAELEHESGRPSEPQHKKDA